MNCREIPNPFAPALHQVLLPEGWARPRGYSNGMRASGTAIIVGGQIGWNEKGEFPAGFIDQVAQTLENVVAVLKAGGAGPEHLVRFTWYVTDMAEYRASLTHLGPHYRRIIGRHYPPMAVVGVTELVEPEAHVEIEALAIVPDH